MEQAIRSRLGSLLHDVVDHAEYSIRKRRRLIIDLMDYVTTDARDVILQSRRLRRIVSEKLLEFKADFRVGSYVARWWKLLFNEPFPHSCTSTITR